MCVSGHKLIDGGTDERFLLRVNDEIALVVAKKRRRVGGYWNDDVRVATIVTFEERLNGPGFNEPESEKEQKALRTDLLVPISRVNLKQYLLSRI